MFTGIVEDIGTILGVRLESGVTRLDVKTSLDLDDTKLGDSIACNGVCLTVTAKDRRRATFDVGPETTAVSTFKSLRVGGRLHLERALRLSDRLGGHLVQGHVDGVGTLASRVQAGDTLKLVLDVPKTIAALSIDKGSIAIDGVSLTINAVTNSTIGVWLIPHTLTGTRLGDLRIGDRVNLENDVIGKYVAKMLAGKESGVTWDLLAKHGFGTPHIP